MQEQESFLPTALLGEEVKEKSGGASEGRGWGVHRVDACRTGSRQAHWGDKTFPWDVGVLGLGLCPPRDIVPGTP